MLLLVRSDIQKNRLLEGAPGETTNQKSAPRPSNFDEVIE
jgi:hypothetical protein